jgi:SAM-dependent methyltransferase
MRSSYPVYRFRVAGHSIFARLSRKTCFGYSTTRPYFEGRSGLEFGGPSSIFSAGHLVPIYNIVQSIDLCNFAEQTIWKPQRALLGLVSRLGKQFIAEAGDPAEIADESYDFVLASHVLEHVANPLRALSEWKRILKPSGTILVVVPHKNGTFDHRRPFTAFEHLKADFESNTTEADLTHLQEILELHDLVRDPPAGSAKQFRERCMQNASRRAMHHHVFSSEVLIEMFSFLAMRVLNVAVERPYHIIVHARKSVQMEPGDECLENSSFLRPEAEWRGHDPFRSSFRLRALPGHSKS